MTIYKKASDHFVLTNKINPTANMTIATHTLFVDGNLLVGGNASTITKTDLAVSDNIIVLNVGETGSGVTLGYAGIEIDRGLAANVVLRYNESAHRWQLTNDGSSFGNILISEGAGSIVIENDIAPVLGGTLVTNNHVIISGGYGNVIFDDNVAIKNTTVAPTPVAGYDVLYTQAPNSGGSGLYVTNTVTQNQELSTQRRNIVYSLVL